MASNNEWLNERTQDVRASIDAIGRLQSQLSYLQIGWRPPTGGWSIGQVFEHLIISDSLYLPKLWQLAERGKRGDMPWSCTADAARALRAPRARVPRHASRVAPRSAQGFSSLRSRFAPLGAWQCELQRFELRAMTVRPNDRTQPTSSRFC
ncbi:MAG: DinB family protein [Gemmatimonadota bacterium]